MKHYGDITLLKGQNLPPVDIITGGSPCQDLSIAGKRAGLAGERSGLFMEQIRIVKEMRDETSRMTDELIRLRYMVWENVPGAFSSNGGEDFRAVLEETAKVAERDACIPRFEGNNGKWTPSGCIMGNGWSIAWRVHDAQFWGVPQRRKRIALIADFGGYTAPEILFERESVPGNPEQSGTQGEGTAETAERRAEGASKGIAYCIAGNTIERKPGNGGNGLGAHGDVSYTLNTVDRHAVCNTFDVRISSDGTKNWRAHAYQTDISRSLDTAEPNPDSNHGGVAIVECEQKDKICVENFKADGAEGKGIAFATVGDHENRPTDMTNLIVGKPDKENFNAVVQRMEVFHCTTETEKVQTLKARDYKDPQCVAYGTHSIVRRLTPLECERLQGYPDYWTDIGDWIDSKGKKHKGDSDAPRYKALGNSIALPFWQWMAERMCKYIDNPTMASLFDGIGGFPLVFSRSGCKPIWASEIEEFPIAVTKIRFQEDEEWQKE